jgi:putative peptide zinc metalloprotease protein
MSRFSADTRVRFLPFSRQADGDEVVIGRPETSTFLALPAEAVELLDELAGGKTIGQVQAEHLARTGETPDLEDLLSYLDEKGFLAAESLPAAAQASSARARPEKPQPSRFHFSFFPESLARKIFSLPLLLAAGLLILAAVAAAVAEPALRPSWRFLFFESNVTLMASLLMLGGLAVTFFHEMGHLVAARARGISCSLGIGNRLWILVAETDMTGVWSLPRNQRYLPILAGPLVDAVSGSLLILILYAQLAGWLELPSAAVALVRAMTMVYLLKILWQCYFFVRTDFYYVYTMAFGCKNLLKDTQDFLKNCWAGLLGRGRPVDQSHIPAREMKAVRAYSGFWLVGRILALSMFALVIVPLIFRYLLSLGATLLSPGASSAYQLADAGAFTFISMAMLLVGIWLWIKGIFQNWRFQRVLALHDSSAKS